MLLLGRRSPFSTGGLETRLLLRNAANGVYDFDDALFNDNGTGLRRLLAKARTCELAVRAADHVIAGNEYLADWAGSRNKSEVTIIPSCVRPNDYVAKTRWELRGSGLSDWCGWAPSRLNASCSRSRVRLLHAHRTRGARLTVVSRPGVRFPRRAGPDGRPGRLGSSAPTPIISPAATSASVPSRDTPYARGKSAYKLLQYAAAALPVVGSPVGANALALERFAGIAPCNGAKNGPTDRRRSSTRPLHNGVTAGSARIVEQHYSITSWAETWRDAVLPEQEWRAPAP